MGNLKEYFCKNGAVFSHCILSFSPATTYLFKLKSRQEKIKPWNLKKSGKIRTFHRTSSFYAPHHIFVQPNHSFVFLSIFLQTLEATVRKHIPPIRVVKRGKPHPNIAFSRVFGINSLCDQYRIKQCIQIINMYCKRIKE